MARILTNKPNAIREVVDACCGGASSLSQALSHKLRLGRRCSGCVGGCDECRVPRPFWWPQLVAEISSYVCPGGVTTLRVIVRNMGPTPRKYAVAVLPPALASNASVSEPSFELLPFQRKQVTVSYIVPGTVDVGQTEEPLVWVRGCGIHAILWRVIASKQSSSVCNEIELDDAPDYEHHWYDHFYCEHPCRNSKS